MKDQEFESTKTRLEWVEHLRKDLLYIFGEEFIHHTIRVHKTVDPLKFYMKIYLKVDRERIKDIRIQVLGCPGAIAAAMVAMDLAKDKTVEEALKITDRDIFRILEELPDQKLHCVRLAVKTLQKALNEYTGQEGPPSTEDNDATV